MFKKKKGHCDGPSFSITGVFMRQDRTPNEDRQTFTYQGKGPRKQPTQLTMGSGPAASRLKRKFPFVNRVSVVKVTQTLVQHNRH